MALGDLAGSLPLTADTFFAVAETCPDAIVLADESGQIVYLNQAATRTFGYPPDEALGRPLTLLIPDRFHQAHSEGLSRYLATGTSKLIGRTVEVPARRKDGKEFPVELSLGSWKQGGKSYFAGPSGTSPSGANSTRRLREARPCPGLFLIRTSSGSSPPT
ncbi:MAG TPA: PAS domain S-box protein [Planctomycetota bacterium]|nr:PAS domain S-box protein [Planctomycetota bacterium]